MHDQNSALITLGWDVGGAHLKVALVNTDGVALQVVQVKCRLWLGIEQLEQAVDEVLGQLQYAAGQHVVTMTGELADIFPDRISGVMQIADVMRQKLSGQVTFYAGTSGFVAIADVAYKSAAIASANWLASASFLAKQIPQALFIDIGSTTADIVLLNEGHPFTRGISDAERMKSESLIYTGVVRTPVMAVSSRVPFLGEWVTLAAEYFSTMADIYRLTGDLKLADDMADTADGAGKTVEDSARRLARMIGHDLDDAPMSAWVALANAFKQQQLNRLKDAVLRHYSCGIIDADAPMIGAGVGRFLVFELANQLNRDYYDASNFIRAQTDTTKYWASACLPAYAVAALR
ncbi:S-layer protein [Methylovorus sp. MM2]|uniref:hydantoinase/oxoprolinase family protein n=1 Tax=Methylovorus sp. MM2 TaxID=1848038 RepID=UPI0007E1020D|nr:hydantoinase/oxoprolinase family protein [Methylovorus sp. MM2]OAM52889.1 S-layer protein [Methylovorus sp. MM2]